MGKIRVDIIGAGFLYAALMLLIDGVPGAKEGASYLAAQGILWGVALACLCSIAFWLRRKKSPSFVEGREFACVSFGAAIVSVATIIAWTGLLPPFVPGLFAGASLALMGMIWLRTCARYAMVDVLASSAIALAVDGMVRFSTTSLFSAQWYFPAVLLSVAASAVLFQAPHWIDASSSEETCGDEPDSSTSLGQRFSFALKILWLPASGAMLSVFIFGLTWDPVASGEIAHSTLPLYEARLFIGPCIAATVTAVIVFHRPSSAVFLMQGILLPCAVAVILVLPALRVESVWVQALFQIVQSAGFSAIALVTWASLVAAVRSVRTTAPAALCLSIFPWRRCSAWRLSIP